MIDFTIDSTVTRVSISAIEDDEDDLDEDEEPSYSRLITIETADGAFRIELVSDDRSNLEIEED